MEKIIDTIDYDFPACGGVTVEKGRKNYTVTRESNYWGSWTSQIATVPISSLPGKYTDAEWDEIVGQIFHGDICGAKIIRRGYKVQ